MENYTLPMFLWHSVAGDIWRRMAMSAASVQPNWPEIETASNNAEVLAMVERRFPTSIIDSVLGLGFERAEVHSVVLPARTLQHRRSRKELLTVEESDRVIRLLRVLRATEAVYGSRERALEWLRRPNPRLDPALRDVLFARGGRAPISLLTTDTGARMVEELLGQIAHGMFI
jgi:putative toxin-antitoxin system antitoxin component (TIGR02293 family)